MGLLGSLGQVAYDIIANDGTGPGSDSARAKMMAVGAAMTGVGVGAKLMVDDVNRSFLEFDESMTAVKALGGTSEEEFQRMKDACVDMSTSVPVSATDVSNAMYSMISVGYDFDTMMATIPEATKLAVGGNLELADATNAVINVFGAYGTEAYSAADITNILAKAVGVGKWELDDFLTEMQKNVGVAAQLGISFEDLAAANVLLQNKFTSAEEAGTALKTMLLRMVDPNVQKQLEELGIHVKDNEGNFVGLESVLNQLDAALQSSGGNVDKMSTLQKIFGTEGLRAAMALIDEKDKLNETSAAMNDATFKNQAYNTVLESTGSQLEIAENKMIAAKLALAEGMVPATELAADAMGGMADILKSLPEPLQGVAGMAVFAAQGFAVLGPALMGLAAIKSLGLAASIGSIGTSLAGAASSIGVFVVAAAPLLVILAGLALGLAAVWALNELGVFDYIYNAGYEFGGFVSGAGADFMGWLNDLPGAAQSACDSTANWFAGLPGVIEGAISGVAGTVGGAFDGVTTAVGTALSGIPGALATSFGDITTAFSALGGSVQGAFTSLFTGISDFIVGLAQGFVTAGYNIIMYIVQGMQSAAGAIGSTISNIFGILSQYIPHSPAETGPLSQLPNFSAYLVDPLLATVPAVQAASLQVAEAATMPVAQPASLSSSTSSTTTNDNSMSVGTINAKEQSITDIMAQIAAVQAQKRTQRGVSSG